MAKSISYTLITLGFILFSSNLVFGTTNPLQFDEKRIEQHRTWSQKSIQQELGRKLTWSEKAAFWFLKKQLKKKKKGKEKKEIDKMANASFYMGLASLVVLAVAFPLGLILGVLAAIFGVIGLNRISKYDRGGRDLAIIGAICGLAAVVLSIAFTVFIVFLFLAL